MIDYGFFFMIDHTIMCFFMIDYTILTHTRFKAIAAINVEVRHSQTYPTADLSGFFNSHFFCSLKKYDWSYKKMNNQKQINLLDTAVPSIGVETLHPTLFRRAVKSLKTSAAKVANAAKRRWNKFYDWLWATFHRHRANWSSSLYRNSRIVLNNYFTALLISKLKRKRRAIKGYFKSFVINGYEYKDPRLYLSDVQLTVTRVIENN